MSKDEKEPDPYELLEKQLNRIWAMERCLKIVAIISSHNKYREVRFIGADLLLLIHTEVNKALEDDDRARREL